MRSMMRSPEVYTLTADASRIAGHQHKGISATQTLLRSRLGRCDASPLLPSERERVTLLPDSVMPWRRLVCIKISSDKDGRPGAVCIC